MKENIKAPWYEFYKGVRRHLDYPEYSIYKQLEIAGIKYPKFIALNYFKHKLTFKELLEEIDTCARALKKLGIKKKDKVTICMPNTPEAIISFYAVNKIGAIANVIHPLSAENEIKYALELTKSKMIITVDIAWEKVNNILKDTKVKNSVIVSVKDSMPALTGIGYYILKGKDIKKPEYGSNIFTWKDFLKCSKDYKKDTYEATNKDDEAVILYSGGTTGTSKGIVLTNLNFNAVAHQCFEACVCLQPGMKVLSILPIFHGFGLGICIHTVLSFGMSAIILPQFNVNTFDKLLGKYKPNGIVGPPTLYEALLKNKNLDKMDLSFIKIAVAGGDSLTVSMKNKIDTFLKNHNCDAVIRQGYGLTECVAASCLTPINDYRNGSIGVPMPDMFYKIVKPGTDTELPYGKEGEIVINGPTVMKEYFNNKEETKSTLIKHKDGNIWLHTGDLGTMDKEGFVYFSQRLKRMIVSSGYNVYPNRVESVIEELPFVVKSCVVGVDHPYKVQVAKAFVVLKPDVEPNEEARNVIYDHCVKNLARYSLPYEIEFIKELPKTKVNKIDYRKLEEQERQKNKKA